METRDFWRPTKAAAERMAALGIHPERREPPYARMYYGTDLPDEFVVLYPGTPACETVIGIATEPVAVVMAKAAALAVERLPLRPSCGSPDGQTAHDEAVAVDALVACGHHRPEHNGRPLPWWYHGMFGHAYYAAFMAARQNL